MTQKELNGFVDYGTGSIKPSFDSRGEYIKVLRKCMENIAEAQTLANHSLWLRLLRTYYCLTIAFIQQKDAEIIKAGMNEINSKIKRLSKSNQQLQNAEIIKDQIDNDLNEITELMYLKTGHLLLPVSESDATDIDDPNFFDDDD